MTIKKKNEKKDLKTRSTEVLTAEFINSGGNAPSELGCDVSNSDTDLLEEMIRFTLRIPKEMINGVDTHRKKRVGNVSRNNWILEAIAEKVKLEQN